MSEDYKTMLTHTQAADIIYISRVPEVNANLVKPSCPRQTKLLDAGLDPDNMPPHLELDMNSEAKAWRTLYSASHGVGSINDQRSAADLSDVYNWKTGRLPGKPAGAGSRYPAC